MTWFNAGVAGFWYSPGKVPPFCAPEKFLEIPGEPEPGTVQYLDIVLEVPVQLHDRFVFHARTRVHLIRAREHIIPALCAG